VMADRIAVMRAGTIEQVADGRAVYDRPATPFVADFIGETNWLRGRSRGVDDGAATVALEAGGVARVPLGFGAGVPSSGPLVLGVRPERMRVLAAGQAVGARQAAISATLTKVVFQGAQVTLEAITESGERLSILRQHSGSDADGIPVPEPRTPVLVAWDESSTLLFPAADFASRHAREDEI
jgi:spermidine/putrescine transport system ATP-binding protein